MRADIPASLVLVRFCKELIVMMSAMGKYNFEDIRKWIGINEATVAELHDPCVAVYDPADQPRLMVSEWEKQAGQVNCMAYALNAPGEIINPGGVRPGSVSEVAEAFRKGASLSGSMLSAVRRGLEEDGLKPVQHGSGIYRRGHYLVALFMNSRRGDYHFMRQDSDGLWSQMNFMTTGVSRKDISGTPVINPATAKMGPGVRFVGFYHVPRGGAAALRGHSPPTSTRMMSAPQHDSL